MNRRKLLKGALGAGVASVAGHAIADEFETVHPSKGVSYKALYYEAQRELDELYEALAIDPFKQVLGQGRAYYEWDGESMRLIERR